ncbi:hypothetical protein HQ571_01045 [Candidatus Kuenenbacteria bacterium]|nr:hypothetical protein [Candidatus Kuenenbacteria bacterium]
MNDTQVAQIEGLLKNSELDNRSQELMRQFFNSIAEQPQYPKIVSLLERFPSVFENFCNCFQVKRDFLKQGKSEEEWNTFVAKEDEMFEQMEKEE